MSWWPTPAVWRESGMDVGYWTSANEAWFQKRHHDILHKNAQLYMAKRWKEKLKYNIKDTRKLEDTVTRLSRETFM